MHRHRLVTLQIYCGSVQHSVGADSSIGGYSAGSFSTHLRLDPCTGIALSTATAAQCSTVSVLIRASVAAARY
jgi:hypothetical protein